MRMTILSLVLLSSAQSFAAFKGSLAFTPAEKNAHLNNIKSLTAEADDCLKEDLNRQNSFFKKYGISAFYGDRSAFAKLSQKQKADYLVSKGLKPSLLSELAPTSCVGMALKCLERGFKKTEQAETFKRLKAFVMLNSVDGTALQHGLQMLGWKNLYWNPDTSKNKRWDLQEKAADPQNKNYFRGFHEDNFVAVKTKKRYYYNNIDDGKSLIDFKEEPPRFFKNIPFFIGTAHMGYHVFPGSYGQVVEAHSMRPLTDPDTVESAPFNPLAEGGAPRGLYRSGIVTIPPTF
jgi:hypothetical protein